MTEPTAATGARSATETRLLTTDDMAAAFALRFAVFVAEQQVPEDEERDEHDATAVHAGAFDGDRLVATGRLVALPDRVGKVGRMAVAADARGRGLGAAVLARLEQVAGERGMREVVLGAQLTAVSFYERSGYTAYGDVFDDAGIDHVMMRKWLVRASAAGAAARAAGAGGTGSEET